MTQSTPRPLTSTLAAAAAAVLALLAVLAASPSTASAAVCADHPNQRSAQEAKDTRDADSDGIYCEALPCPCLKPGQGSAPKRVRKPSAPRKVKVKPKAKVGPPMVFRDVEVIQAIDGDTISVLLPGRDAPTNVRLVGIDAPDAGPRHNGIAECGGLDATLAVQRLVRRWQRVTLRIDPKQYRYDVAGQLLAYVEPAGNPKTTYQQQLLNEGWVDVDVIGGLQRAGRFNDAHGKAQLDGAGVWSQCAGDFHAPEEALPAPLTADRSGDRTIVVTSEGFVRAGSWKPSRDGFELRSLARLWGPPDDYSDCEATWYDYGVRVRTFGYAYRDGCDTLSRAGAVKNLAFTGAGWRTHRGLAIGDTLDRLGSLYPGAPDYPNWDDERGVTYAPLSGYFLGGPDGPLKAVLAAEAGDQDTITSIETTLIFGA